MSDASAGGKDVLNGHHNQQQRQRHAHRRKGSVVSQRTDIGRVYNIVYRLCQQSQRSGYGQLYDGF